MVLIYIFQMASNVQYLFICLLAIFAASLEKYLFEYFACLKLGSLILFFPNFYLFVRLPLWVQE